jgi:hypothetical protein
MYAFPGAYQPPGGGKKKKKKKKNRGGGRGGNGGGGGGKAAANQVRRIVENANGDIARVTHEIEGFLRQQRGGRLDLKVEHLCELVTTVVRSGAVEAAGLLVEAYRGGPEGDTPFTPGDAMREPDPPPPPAGLIGAECGACGCRFNPDLFEALPQQFNVDPMVGAAFVDRVSAMVQFGRQEELQVPPSHPPSPIVAPSPIHSVRGHIPQYSNTPSQSAQAPGRS